MFKTRRKKKIIIDLGEYVLEHKVVPTPTYSKGKEISHIVQPRGIIFSRFRNALKIK